MAHNRSRVEDNISWGRVIETRRVQVRIRGVVQGVGFRPFVWKRAEECQLSGWVKNDAAGVTIEVQGTEQRLQQFLRGFGRELPPLAGIDSIDVIDIEPLSQGGFSILDSSSRESQSTAISPDTSVCDDCLGEFGDPQNRRYNYPFINCTNCGPRFTIVQDIPYDRPLTTMRSFRMCDDCQREYEDPSNRRFHAQPNACPECGPAVWFVAGAADEEQLVAPSVPDARISAARAISAFHQAIQQGLIVAVKGIGGFHLACDATNKNAVRTLRERKGRIDKPLAVLVQNVEQAGHFAVIDDRQRRLLESQQRPIVLLPKRPNATAAIQQLQSSVAPGNDFVGVMLPYSPLHHLLIHDAPLVLTSGNLTDEPIVRANGEAARRLAKIADGFLFHDREINVVCDDSVVRCLEGNLVPIRRSRGYAPMPVKLSMPGRSVLAVGGEIKSTFCVTKDNYAYMSQHIGDMGNLETLHAMRRCVEYFMRLFRVNVKGIAADLHPGYLSGQWAEQFSRSLDVPLIRVQHHFAHVVSLLAEHNIPADHPIIGCCFDGTGFGTDKAIWGGEFMVASVEKFDRFAQLAYTPLPGGDDSIQRPYRTALAHLWACNLDWNDQLPCVSACPQPERRVLRQQLEQNLNCVPTSSMGRLFDAVASLIGVRHVVNYEAQAAMELEALAARAAGDVHSDAYSFQLRKTTLIEIDSTDVLKQICANVLAGLNPRLIGARFHHAVANLVVEVCQLAERETRIRTVGLTGGVFQNVLLLKLTSEKLNRAGFDVLIHRIVPPNDGGLALGQAVIARCRLQ